MKQSGALRRARLGGVLLGIGLGGFVDGIVFHQILQWHHMLSSVLPPDTMSAMQTNMVWDGLFHGFVWLVTLVGIYLIWSVARRPVPLPPYRWLTGAMLVGWGLFNLVEGIVNHHLLGIHHVRGYGPDPLWDLAFLASGAVFILLGWILMRPFADYGDDTA